MGLALATGTGLQGEPSERKIRTGIVMQSQRGTGSKILSKEEKGNGNFENQQLVISALHWVFRRAVLFQLLSTLQQLKGSKHKLCWIMQLLQKRRNLSSIRM